MIQMTRNRTGKRYPITADLESALLEMVGESNRGSTFAALHAGTAALGGDDPAVARLRAAIARLAQDEPDSKPDDWYEEELDAENALTDAIVAAGESAVACAMAALDDDHRYDVIEEEI